MNIQLIQCTPNPEEVVISAARNDYMTDWIGDMDIEEIMDTTSSSKEEFIQRLMDRGHWGPFEHPSFTVTFEGISRVAMAQATRHRHASFDVQSLRYTVPESAEQDAESISELFVTPESVADDHDTEAVFEEHSIEAFRKYQRLIDAGVPKEDARFVLPMGTSVNMVVSMNARSLMHFLDMRHKADAQWEIREMAKKLLYIAKQKMPRTFEYYEQAFCPRQNQLAP